MLPHPRPILFAVLAVLMAGSAAGQGSPIAPVRSIPYVHHVPVVEEFVRAQEIADAHTAGMAVIDGLIQRAPDDGALVSERTRVYLGYDNENFYAAFICFDSVPSRIRGQRAPRERISDDDDNVALHLDTFGDRKHAYGFQVNAAGVQRDGIWNESAATWDFSFDAIWHAESRRTPYGYVVLITIPVSSLRFAARAEQAWGLFVFREIPRKGELAYWPAYSSRRAGRLPQAATATGIRGLASTRDLQLTPYATAERGGADAKWVVRNSYVVDATINPDFSQVESDEPQVTVNERFETLFPEKRPFFVENAGYFSTPIPLFFTRRIVDPGIGLRVTGRQGPYGVAALVADDEAPGGTRSGRASAAVGRATRNVGRDGFIGAFVSTRAHGANANRTAGVDGRFAVGSNWTGVWQAVTTATSEGGRTVGAGPAYVARLTRSGRSVTYAAEWHDRGAGFRADTGYVPRTDFRSLDQTLTYRFRPAGRYLVAWGPDLSMTRVWDRQGRRLDSAVTPRLTFEWTGPVMLAVFHSVAQRRLRGPEVSALVEALDTDADRTGIELTFNRFSRIVWTATVSDGAGVNLRPVADQPPDGATDFEAKLTASARLTRGFTIDATVLTRQVAEQATAASVLENVIWRLKGTYQFSPLIGVRLIAQRDTLATNPAVTALPPYSEATTDVLLTYLAAPGRALFIGATRHDVWQFFVKVSYAFQL